MKILLKNFSAITLSSPAVLENGSISIEDGAITGIFSQNIPLPPLQFDEILDGHKKLVMPGFVNAHTHLAMVMLRGYADDLPLKRWLEEEIWPLEAKLTSDDIYWGAQLGMAEMIRSGTTCFADMYYQMGRVMEAVKESGMRALLAEGLFAQKPGQRMDEIFRTTQDFIAQVKTENHSRIRVALGPHAPYTVCAEAWERIVDLAHQHQIPVHTHLSETRSEVQTSLELWKKTPVEHLESLGVFDARALAAHCVHVAEHDIEILASHNVNVIHNPTSNLKLASGFAPIQRLQRAGINVAIGTDGASSNNNLDMIEEIRLATLIQKGILEDATAFPALEALRAGTERGAQALGWGDVGKIEIGQRADLVILDIDTPHWVPGYDLVSNLVYSAQAADVRTVIIDGDLVMHDYEMRTLDEEKAKAMAQEFQQKYRRR
ncbi:amidohydrolase [Candidatus Acetothermia bacterium]|nr:amidohydrolase [Candidatus Acetothermia bacterium]MBI3642809.1 amidohydrolase [Candidatus Acetothermia bacterium]